MWSIRGIHLIDVLPNGERFTSSYACHMLDRLDSNMRRLRPKMGLRGMKIHWDNARPHRSSETRAKLQSLGCAELPHPPYSPDLAPSDYYLFGYIKSKLKGTCSADSEELFAKVTLITEEIEKTTLSGVFSEWVRRLDVMRKSNGDYITK